MSDPKNIKRRDLQRALVRLELEIETIREEGRGKGDVPSWYALDRIAAIREVCDALLKDDPMACVADFGQHQNGIHARRLIDKLDQYVETGLRY